MYRHRLTPIFAIAFTAILLAGMTFQPYAAASTTKAQALKMTSRKTTELQTGRLQM